MVAVASLMAAQIVQANIDTNAQHELIDKTLKEIGDSRRRDKEKDEHCDDHENCIRQKLEVQVK